jgi:hypothetical protein
MCLFELFGPHWTLLGYDVARDLVPSRAELHIHTIGARGDVFDESGHFRDAYALVPRNCVFVRPDGYVGAIILRARSQRWKHIFERLVSALSMAGARGRSRRNGARRYIQSEHASIIIFDRLSAAPYSIAAQVSFTPRSGWRAQASKSLLRPAISRGAHLPHSGNHSYCQNAFACRQSL